MTSTKKTAKKDKREVVYSFEKYGLKVEFPKPFLQEHLEDYQAKMQELTNEHRGHPALNTNGMYRRFSVMAAMRCGWSTGFGEEELSKKHPGITEVLSGEIHFFISTMRIPPPE